MGVVVQNCNSIFLTGTWLRILSWHQHFLKPCANTPKMLLSCDDRDIFFYLHCSAFFICQCCSLLYMQSMWVICIKLIEKDIYDRYFTLLWNDILLQNDHIYSFSTKSITFPIYGKWPKLWEHVRNWIISSEQKEQAVSLFLVIHKFMAKDVWMHIHNLFPIKIRLTIWRRKVLSSAS